jgi:hypothetical protein
LSKEKFDKCIFLQSGVVHQDVWHQAIKTIEENVQNDVYCSIEQHLPSVLSDLSDTDVESLLAELKKLHSSWNIVSGNEHIVYDQKFLQKTLSALDPWLQEKAKSDAPSVINRIKDLQTKKCANEATKKKDDDVNIFYMYNKFILGRLGQ